MEKTINEIADRLYKEMEAFFAPDITDNFKEIAKSRIHMAIRHTVSDTGSYINTVLHESVSKSKQ
jgi:hypothetical protein